MVKHTQTIHRQHPVTKEKGYPVEIIIKLSLTLAIFCLKGELPLQASTPQNGQTYSENLPATADELFECVYHFVVMVLKGLMIV